MRRRSGHSQMLHLWVFECFTDAVYRAARYADRIQPLDQLRRREPPRHLANDFVQALSVTRARPAIGKRRIAQQFRRVQRFAEALPHLAGARGEIDQSVLRFIGAHRHLHRVKVALLARNFLVHRVARTLEIELAQHPLEQRRMHPLAFAGALPMQQREQNPLPEKHAGGGVGDRDADTHRRPARFAGDRHQPAHALHDLIDARTIAVWPVLAEAGDAREDDARVDLSQLRVIDAEARLHVGAKVLHHDVGARDQPTKQCRAVGVLQVDAHAALVAMQVLVVGAVASAGHRAAGRVPPRRRLDLDDVRAPIRQQPHRGRTGASDGQIEHDIARQRQSGRAIARRFIRHADGSPSCVFRRRVGRHPRIFVRLQRRQLAQECNDGPDRIVVVRHAPCRHRGHLDAVLDDPETARRRGLAVVARELRRCERRRHRIQPLSELVVGDPRREVTSLAHFGVLGGARGDKRRRIELRHFDGDRAHRDRPFARRLGEPAHHRAVRRIGGHVVEADVDIGQRRQRDDQ